MSTAETAFLELADHSVGCPVCRPDADAPTEERPVCAVALELYRVWRRAWRAARGAAAR
ncbi:hypothetical protein GCM10009535_40220 [Streptomyces thermocarboxydovorans]|uniref:Uncharacterized protein n=1 Tax=Streptomyces thermocarboxydovorans TaxID=59298 RepID=A0ABN1HKT3_9ACTN